MVEAVPAAYSVVEVIGLCSLSAVGLAMAFFLFALAIDIWRDR